MLQILVRSYMNTHTHLIQRVHILILRNKYPQLRTRPSNSTQRSTFRQELVSNRSLFMSDPQCITGSISSTQAGRQPQPPRRRCWAGWASSRANSLVSSPSRSVSVSSAGPSGRCWRSSPRGVAFSHCKATGVSGQSAENSVSHRDRNNRGQQRNSWEQIHADMTDSPEMFSMSTISGPRWTARNCIWPRQISEPSNFCFSFRISGTKSDCVIDGAVQHFVLLIWMKSFHLRFQVIICRKCTTFKKQLYQWWTAAL